MLIRSATTILLLALGAATADAQEHTGHAAHPADHHDSDRMPLLEGLGRWHHDVTTAAPDAQKYFDQGLRLAYAFNHDESARSFEQALRLDPTCAMCAWGVAYALSPNINLPMDSAKEVRALAAIRQAQEQSSTATARERDYIAALARRFGEPAGAERAQRDSAYASAMREVAQRYPDDADAQVLFADALLNLRPWNQWTRAGNPQPGTLEVVDVLQRVVDTTPDHAGACHFHVHAVEASPSPERALECAERLPKLMAGAGHVVHMPAHVYLRTGQYEKAARANIAAVEADHRYFDGNDVQSGVYPLFYHPHNIHFLWAAYMMSGQQEKSLAAAHALRERVSIEMARSETSLQAFLTPVMLTNLRFGDWDAVLAASAPDAGLTYVRGIWHHARGVALVQQGRFTEAAAALDSVRAVAASTPEDMIVIMNSARAVLRIAELVLAGRLAAGTGEVAEALTLLREAAALEDELTYDEPPPWYQPVRQVMGEVLMDAGQFGAAEDAFRDDLRWVRENGWSLAGLERALRAQGKTAEADAVAERLEEAWEHADVSPEPAAARVRFRESRLRTGARIHWAESGDPAGEAVVLLHGYSDSWFSFSPVLPLLPTGIRAIAIDMRGHGNSGDVPASFRVDDLAADVAALMDELGILRATIVGHSYGSLVAQSFAAANPSRTRGLVLIGAISDGAVPVLSELRAVVHELPDPVPGEFTREFQLSTTAQPLPEPFLERVMLESAKMSLQAWRGIADGWSGVDYLDRIAAAGIPTMLLWGDRDTYFPIDVQQTITTRVPGARLIRYEGIGHAVHWEDAERVAEDLVKFMSAAGQEGADS